MAKRYQRGNQNPYIKEEQTTQWTKDTKGDCPFGIFWPLCCLFFFDIQILITPLVSFGHCVVCSSLIYRFWLHLWYLLAIVLSVLLWYIDSDYTFGQTEYIDQRRTDNTMAKRRQRCNQNLYIKEEQTTQRPKDTKGAIRIHISKKNRQRNSQKIPKV
jgi:phage FluMu protein Com